MSVRSSTTRSLSLRGENEVSDAAIHVLTVQSALAYWFTVDRHGLRPRDDKMWSE